MWEESQVVCNVQVVQLVPKCQLDIIIRAFCGLSHNPVSCQQEEKRWQLRHHCLAFLHSCRLPFFGSLILTGNPCFQPVSTFSLSYVFPNRLHVQHLWWWFPCQPWLLMQINMFTFASCSSILQEIDCFAGLCLTWFSAVDLEAFFYRWDVLVVRWF